MVGRRSRSHFVVLLFGALLWASGAVAGPKLPPAPYKPLPVGTKLNYGSWKCTVAKSEGFETVCDNRRISVSTHGVFVASYDDEVEWMMGSVAEVVCSSYAGGQQLSPVSIDDGARSSIEKFWPLKIGNKSTFDISTNLAKAKVSMSVDRTEDVRIAGKSRSTYVVVQEVNFEAIEISIGRRFGQPCYPSFRRTVWYEPALGIVVKDRMRWLNGAFPGTGWEYELVKATFPKAPVVAKAAPLPKPPVARPAPRVAKPTAVAAATTRGSTPPPVPRARARPAAYADIHFGAYHALVIGNNDYAHLPRLRTAVNDATTVAGLLRSQYGFETKLLVNATRADVIGALARYRAKLKFDDNLLVYFAGHGVLDDLGQQGYWLPVDADEDVPTNWISTNAVTVMLRAIRAKHVMVVADSCYSGTLVRAAPVRLKTATERGAWIERMVKKRSRTALVSGGLEPVLDSGGGDHSVFAEAFITALNENADVMEGQRLFDAIKRPVALESDQTPQYSDIRRAGHKGGDFLFVRRR